VYDRYDEDKIQHILEWQRRAVANDKNKAMRMGLILDDCMGETNKDGTKKKIMNSGTIGKIFKIGRHRKLFFWATLQYMRDAPPDARSNTDLLFLYNILIISNFVCLNHIKSDRLIYILLPNTKLRKYIPQQIIR
jgi:hypothetical protein